MSKFEIIDHKGLHICTCTTTHQSADVNSKTQKLSQSKI